MLNFIRHHENGKPKPARDGATEQSGCLCWEGQSRQCWPGRQEEGAVKTNTAGAMCMCTAPI